MLQKTFLGEIEKIVFSEFDSQKEIDMTPHNTYIKSNSLRDTNTWVNNIWKMPYKKVSHGKPKNFIDIDKSDHNGMKIWLRHQYSLFPSIQLNEKT